VEVYGKMWPKSRSGKEINFYIFSGRGWVGNMVQRRGGNSREELFGDSGMRPVHGCDRDKQN
jgi:hypothetical protein